MYTDYETALSYVLGLGLQLVQGTIGPNRFGPDPKRPGLMPTLLGPLLSSDYQP